MPFAPCCVSRPGSTLHRGQANGEYFAGIGWAFVGGRIPCRMSMTTRSSVSSGLAAVATDGARRQAHEAMIPPNERFILSSPLAGAGDCCAGALRRAALGHHVGVVDRCANVRNGSKTDLAAAF